MSRAQNLIESLARMSDVVHPLSGVTRTPLLVPSFSSKGFRVEKGKSEIRDIQHLMSEYLTESMLISAYDVHHGFLENPGIANWSPELTIVDSGGYETRVDHDLSSSVHVPHTPLPWGPEHYRAVLDNWPRHRKAAFVSYDCPRTRQSVRRQVESASALMSDYPSQAHVFLLKPETSDQETLEDAIAAVEADPTLLNGFHFIGVTEKELGTKISDRMFRVARLRLALDEAKLMAPIHVFGALDPLTSILFFLSGAEVFDGLTWLRYAYVDDVCVYFANYGTLSCGRSDSDKQVRLRALSHNASYLVELGNRMRSFLLQKDFKCFGVHADKLKDRFDMLATRVARRD